MSAHLLFGIVNSNIHCAPPPDVCAKNFKERTQYWFSISGSWRLLFVYLLHNFFLSREFSLNFLLFQKNFFFHVDEPFQEFFTLLPVLILNRNPKAFFMWTFQLFIFTFGFSFLDFGWEIFKFSTFKYFLFFHFYLQLVFFILILFILIHRESMK